MDAEVLQNQMITAIASQIDTSRTTIRTEIMSNRASSSGDAVPIKNYSVDQAVRDANRYHVECGFLSAIQSLVDKAKTPQLTAESVAAQKKAMQDELADIIKKMNAAGDNEQSKALYQQQMSVVAARLNALTVLTPLMR